MATKKRSSTHGNIIPWGNRFKTLNSGERIAIKTRKAFGEGRLRATVNGKWQYR